MPEETFEICGLCLPPRPPVYNNESVECILKHRHEDEYHSGILSGRKIFWMFECAELADGEECASGEDCDDFIYYFEGDS